VIRKEAGSARKRNRARAKKKDNSREEEQEIMPREENANIVLDIACDHSAQQKVSGYQVEELNSIDEHE
jgi:hypothetical protein